MILDEKALLTKANDEADGTKFKIDVFLNISSRHFNFIMRTFARTVM